MNLFVIILSVEKWLKRHLKEKVSRLFGKCDILAYQNHILLYTKYNKPSIDHESGIVRLSFQLR